MPNAYERQQVQAPAIEGRVLDLVTCSDWLGRCIDSEELGICNSRLLKARIFAALILPAKDDWDCLSHLSFHPNSQPYIDTLPCVYPIENLMIPKTLFPLIFMFFEGQSGKADSSMICCQTFVHWNVSQIW